jgi:hypothetical protein
MVEDEYLVYRKFFSIEEAEPILQLLKEKGVDYRTNNYNSNIGSTFASTNNPNQIELKLLPDQFVLVDNILEQEAKNTIDSLPKDYYLFGFNDDELIEVLEKPFEWTKEDYLLSQQLLAKRGKAISQESLDDLREKYLDELRKPEKSNMLWNIVGYMSSIGGTTLAIFTGWQVSGLILRVGICIVGSLGLFIGWHLMYAKKVLPNGEYFFVYDSKSRFTGRIMFYLGILSPLVSLLIFYVRSANT